MATKCPSCNAQNPDGASFCQQCAYSLSPIPQQQSFKDQPAPPYTYTRKTNRTTWIVVTVILVVVALLIVVATVSVFHALTTSHAPEEAVLKWMFSAGFGQAAGMADKTIAKVIGDGVYNETRDWYSNFLAMYQGHTYVSVSNVQRIPDQELTPVQIGDAEHAVVLLKNDFGVEVKDYCYVHFWITGLGLYNEEMTIGLLKVGSSWYIGYATGVVSLGNI